MVFSKSELISRFSESLGAAKAQELIGEAAGYVGCENNIEYSKEKTINMMEFLKEKGSMIKILANFIIAEILMSD